MCLFLQVELIYLYHWMLRVPSIKSIIFSEVLVLFCSSAMLAFHSSMLALDSASAYELKHVHHTNCKCTSEVNNNCKSTIK